MPAALILLAVPATASAVIASPGWAQGTTIFSRTLDQAELPKHYFFPGFGAIAIATQVGSMAYLDPTPDRFEYQPFGYVGSFGFTTATLVGGPECDNEADFYPLATFGTQQAPACYHSSYNIDTTTPGFMQQWLVPLTATTLDGDPLVFHDWEVTNEPVESGERACSTGFVGGQEGTTPTTAEMDGDPTLYFTRGAQANRFYGGSSANGWLDLPEYNPMFPDGHRSPRGNFSMSTAPMTAVYAPSTPDVSPPISTVLMPEDCETFDRDEEVHADFSCEDPGAVSTVESCIGTRLVGGQPVGGPIADGDLLDTSEAGVHHLRVTTSDSQGNQRSRTVRYRVLGPPKQLTVTKSPAASLPPPSRKSRGSAAEGPARTSSRMVRWCASTRCRAPAPGHRSGTAAIS